MTIQTSKNIEIRSEHFIPLPKCFAFNILWFAVEFIIFSVMTGVVTPACIILLVTF